MPTYSIRPQSLEEWFSTYLATDIPIGNQGNGPMPNLTPSIPFAVEQCPMSRCSHIFTSPLLRDEVMAHIERKHRYYLPYRCDYRTTVRRLCCCQKFWSEEEALFHAATQHLGHIIKVTQVKC